jgi:superfamily II DNA or RNA helicase
MFGFNAPVELRLYQQRALDELKAWIKLNPGKSPVEVMPTGSGKSHDISAY